MLAARLASMPTRAASFDLESHLIQPGLLAPPMVCASVGAWSGARVDGALLTKTEARACFERLLADETITITGANIAYDMLVMAFDAAERGVNLVPAIFAAYRAGRVYDVQIAEALHALANGHLGKDPRTSDKLKDPVTGKPGRYSLAMVVRLVLGRTDAKANDYWRMRYALLEDLPHEQWPVEARTYPVDDAVNTIETALAQTGHLPKVVNHDWEPAEPSYRCRRCKIELSYGAMPECFERAPHRNLHNLAAQVYAAWCLHLGAAWGFTPDPEAVAELEARLTRDHERDAERFRAVGFLRADGSEDQALVKKHTAVAYGCSGVCSVCNGAGKIPSPKTGKPINCAERDADGKAIATCSGTGLVLDSAPVPRSETGLVSISRDALAESGDELLMDYAAWSEADKLREVYLPFLKQGIANDGVTRPIVLRPNVLLETGRTSYGDVIQQLPRKGGIRECIVPRPGKVFYSVDFGSVELVTHAQSCIWIVGWSKLADALNSGIKPHDALGATMMGIGYDDFGARMKSKDPRCKDFRQGAKPGNFGFPGGMGAWKLVLQQRKQGPDTPWPDGPSTLDGGKRGYKGLRFCLLIGGAQRCGEVKVTDWKRKQGPPTCKKCIECAELIRDNWFKQWPENGPYFEHINVVTDRGELVQHVSKRIRGGAEFCANANSYFQGLAADAAKEALCRVTYEQFCVPSSPLYGSHAILFQHDEILGEIDEDAAPEGADRVSEIMVEVLREYCPDVKGTAEPTLMDRWYKQAELVRDPKGRMAVWRPRSET